MNIKKLLEEGWEKRGIYDEPRLSELCDMYKELGYEVLLLDIYADSGEICSECMVQEKERYKILLTKKM
jgi:hypothetical protein